MHRVTRLIFLTAISLVLPAAFDYSCPATSAQHIASLINGVQIQGDPARADEIFQLGTGQIFMMDDDVRRYWFHSRLLRSLPTVLPRPPEEVFEIPQPKLQRSSSEEPLGIYIIDAGPFNEYGHRVCSITTGKRPVPHFVFQGITKITPRYFVVNCLNETGFTGITWEMRFSTSTLNRETLSKLLRHQVKNREDLDGRLRIVAFYRQAEMYREAILELKAITADFPDEGARRKKEIQSLSSALSDYQIEDIKSLQNVGQYNNAKRLIKSFKDRKVDDETLVELGDFEADEKLREKNRQLILDKFKEYIEILKKEEKLVGASAERVDKMLALLNEELGFDNLSRFADFRRFIDDATQQADEKASLAITGWLMGSGSGKQNFSTALSLISVRDLVLEYLKADNHVERDAVLRKLASMEGASVDNISRIVANLKPYGDMQNAEELGPGYYRVKIPSLSEGKEYEYLVQLPPEYNPYRRYPCVVTLCGQGSTPEVQVNWWAGEAVKKDEHRFGYAGFNGHIVIAPMWRGENQLKYNYSVHEHGSVLRSLLDAKKKFSIDTDRVFLSGHSMGGDAAWDISLSHPDLWAGVIPIAAGNEKYVTFYKENVQGSFPMYFVHGEHDYSLEEANVEMWKQYMRNAKNDVMVCQFRGRVHEHFLEEIENLFAWMKVQRRDATKKMNIDCRSYRPWDNFFWWVEVAGFEAKNQILPEEWVIGKPKTPDGKNRAAALIEANVVQNSNTNDYSMNLQVPASHATIWLSPETFDLSKRIKVRGSYVNFQPSVKTLLEDVRTRRDRQHPFWARVNLFRKKSAWQQIEED